MLNKRFLLSHKKSLMMLMMFVGIIFVFIIGCDRDTRYKVLTFFFEGVPEPGAKRSGWGADANMVYMTNVQKLHLEKAGTRAIKVDKLGQKLASRHDFSKDCAQCHIGTLAVKRPELRVQLPDLCYSCHSDLHKEDDNLHGPLVVGECLFCHNAHQAAFVNLQKAPQPDLCFRCHQKADVALIPGHQKAIEGVCTDCHDPHASAAPKLLKLGGIRQNDPNQVN